VYINVRIHGCVCVCVYRCVCVCVCACAKEEMVDRTVHNKVV
jgi:hypothetical protein